MEDRVDQPPRRLALDGARNVRDLGGYPYTAEDGTVGTTAFGSFLRGDSLRRLSARDIARLREYGLVRVIDVRSAFEVRHSRDPFSGGRHEGIDYLHIPMLDQLNSSGMRAQLPVCMFDVYRSLLDDATDEMRAVFEALDAPGCVLFHCRAGKDRTGVIAMLLLGLAGVDDEHLVHDYAATGTYLTPSMRIQRAAATVLLRRRVPRSLFIAAPEEMERTVAYLHETYGSARRYLAGHIRCDTGLLDRLAARLRGAAR